MKLFELFNTNIITEWKREHLVHVFNKEKFKAWFGKSVVMKDDLPMPCFHYTSRDFDVNDFKPFSHFGTWQAAMAIWQYKSDIGGNSGRPNAHAMKKKMINPDLGCWSNRDYDDNTGKWLRTPATHQTFPVFLKITNPLRIVDHGDFHKLSDFNQILYNKKIIDKETANQNADLFVHGNKQKVEQNIIQAMLNAGYDGFVYRNKHEHKGSTSYIILLPTQVKSVMEFFD